jgi:hypothetical protein
MLASYALTKLYYTFMPKALWGGYWHFCVLGVFCCCCYWHTRSWILVSYLLGRHSTTWAILLALLALAIFEIGSCFMPGKLRPWSSCSCFLCGWDDRHAPPRPAIGWHLANILPRLTSNYNPPNLHLSSSWEYRLEPPCLAIYLFYKWRNWSIAKCTKSHN